MMYLTIYITIKTKMQPEIESDSESEQSETFQPQANDNLYVTEIKRSLFVKLDGHQEEFCELLRETGAVIAGGFLVEVVSKCNSNDERYEQNEEQVRFRDLNERTKKSMLPCGLGKDADVFCQCDKSGVIERFFARIGMNAVTTTTKQIYKVNKCIDVVDYDNPTRTRNSSDWKIIYDGDDYYIPNRNKCDVQLVKIAMDPIEYVGQFDISVCKIYFDGTSVVDLTNGDIDTLSFTVDRNQFSGKFNRIEKYLFRGFEWRNANIFRELVDDYRTRLENDGATPESTELFTTVDSLVQGAKTMYKRLRRPSDERDERIRNVLGLFLRQIGELQ